MQYAADFFAMLARQKCGLPPKPSSEVPTKDCGEKQMTPRGRFETDTIWRMCCQVARYWVVEWFLRTQELPPKQTFYVYPDNIDFGDDRRERDESLTPLRRKRIRVTIEIEDYQ